MIFEKIIYVSIILLFLAYYIYRYVKYSNKYALVNIALQIIALTLLTLIYTNNQSISEYMQLVVFICGYVIPLITILSLRFNINYLYECKITLANTYVALNKKDKAKDLYERILEKYKKYEVYKSLGDICLEDEEWKCSLENLSKAVEFKPKDYLTCYKIAFIQYKLSNYDESITILNNVLKVKPKYQIASNLLAYILTFNKNEYNEALKIYFGLLEIYKNNAKIYYNIGATYIKENQSKNAKKFLELAIKYNNKLYNAYYLLGYVHLLNKEYQLAEQNLLIATKGVDTYSKSYYLLARLYMLEKEKGKATNCLNLAIERDDSFVLKIQKENIFQPIIDLVNGVDKIEKIANGRYMNSINNNIPEYISKFEEINVDDYIAFTENIKKEVLATTISKKSSKKNKDKN